MKYVLFDAVGTLIYPDPSPAEIYHEFGNRHGHSLTLDVVRQRFSAAFNKHHVSGATEESIEYRRWQNVIADVFETPTESDLFLALWEHFSRPQAWKVFDDVAETLAELRRRGIAFGIASNFDARLINICRALPLLDQVRPIFHSAAIGWSKPTRPFFQFIENQLEAAPAELLLVGDDPVKDLGGAMNAGWQALLINRSSKKNVHRAITTLTDVLSVFKEFEPKTG